MSSQVKKANMLEVFISCPTLRLNKDYEVLLFSCVMDKHDERGHKREEHIISSISNKKGTGAKINTKEQEFGTVLKVTAAKEEDHWYRLVIRILNNGVLDGPHDIENIDPSFTSKLQSSNLNVQIYSQNS